MSTDPAFDQIARDPDAAFDLLAAKFLAEKQYARLFETRLMRRRRELGLPLIHNGGLDEIPADQRPAYEEAFINAAREAGGLFLADGDIPRAWSYFRAIGEPAPVAAAIERVAVRLGQKFLCRPPRFGKLIGLRIEPGHQTGADPYLDIGGRLHLLREL